VSLDVTNSSAGSEPIRASETVTASKIHFQVAGRATAESAATQHSARRDANRATTARLAELLRDDPPLAKRLQDVTRFARRVRVSEYHLTNACNIRCKGCWFFEYGHDKETREVKDLDAWERFVVRERDERRVNAALVIGGEPAMFLDRLALFVKHLKYVTVSSNGLVKVPMQGFENVAVGLTLFGGGPLDDELRAIKPSGKSFTGLFDTALANYKDDPRATFIYAVTEDGIQYIEETVRRIKANGNNLNFNFYSKYGTGDPSAQAHQKELLAELLRVKSLYPETVVSVPYYIETMITGRSHWSNFGYNVCPSISVDHAAHEGRIANGNPSLPVFNTWSADLKTVKFCCTSGHCDGCRDSQAVFSWLLVSMQQFLGDREQLRTWIEMCESYWSQFYWAPYHRFAANGATDAATDGVAVSA
jgi:MoaA/NifB/PqqE/SkfB family radical SAM enzyme